MKKLTAGILTVMLGIVAANSADASIASKGYVDAQVKTSVSNEAFNTFKTENEAAIADAKKAGTDAKDALDAYKTTNNAEVAKKADTATVNAELAKKQNTLTAADFVKDGTGNVVTGVTVGDDGKIKYSTASVTTSEDFGKLQTTVAGHTTKLDKLTGDGEGSVAKSIADAISGEVNRANGAYATAAQGELAATAVQPSQIADMETKANAAATYATKTEMNAVDGKFANYATTANMNSELALKADKSTIGDVESGKTVVQMIADAKSAASTGTSALANRVKTIEDTGITADKVTQIETNKTDIAANKTAVEAVTNDLATNYTKTANLSALAKAEIPATCTDPNAANGCALILKNGVYLWEVVEREKNN